MLIKRIPPALTIILIIIICAATAFGVRSALRTESDPADQQSAATNVVQAATGNKVTAPDITDTKKWGVIFSDEFDGTTLDETKWSTCYEWYDEASKGCTNEGNNELEWYTPEQISMSGGHVTLTAEQKAIQGKTKEYPYRSGMISSGRQTLDGSVKFEGQFGYYEARMKTQGGQGIWPAFWLLPTDKTWPPEIDIMEFLGHSDDEILLTYHWGDSVEAHEEDSTIIKGIDATNDWHTYSVNWQPGKIEWFIDGKLQKTAEGKTVPAEPMQIILNLAVGGKLPGNPDKTTQFPRQLQVDYVRAYGMVL